MVAWNLRRIRTERGLTIEQLAFDADIDASYLARIERGSANPSVDMLERVCSVLRVRIMELFIEPAPGAPMPKPLKAGRRPRSN